MKKILVTGGAGYIGSHTCVELLNAGFEVVVIDNLCNSKRSSLDRVHRITNNKAIPFVQADLLDTKTLDSVFTTYQPVAVVHFAGLKAVGESVSLPLQYYRNNVCGSVNLLRAMQEHGVRNIVFSSSATVYGEPASLPIKEEFPLSAANPYGQSKLMIEEMLKDLYRSDPAWNISILRYFNPVGAHCSGLIGESPQGIPNNLMPYISQVAVGKLSALAVFGNDYPTTDGTGVRDYIHVVDLARGHIKALEKLTCNPGLMIHNLGTGRGVSVLELVMAFERASGKPVPYKVTERRAGDIASCYADPTLAQQQLGWQAEKGLQQMCEDTWRWQRQNPEGLP
ncbi:MAG TPA: UDP-glucose 4-epimerase GalE [Gammaproteobacteria bacterium]|nr:UDP-glucose 4-epimerase GalE [Gammaproteobacteria bacterium]